MLKTLNINARAVGLLAVLALVLGFVLIAPAVFKSTSAYNAAPAVVQEITDASVGEAEAYTAGSGVCVSSDGSSVWARVAGTWGKFANSQTQPLKNGSCAYHKDGVRAPYSCKTKWRHNYTTWRTLPPGAWVRLRAATRTYLYVDC